MWPSTLPCPGTPAVTAKLTLLPSERDGGIRSGVLPPGPHSTTAFRTSPPPAGLLRPSSPCGARAKGTLAYQPLAELARVEFAAAPTVRSMPGSLAARAAGGAQNAWPCRVGGRAPAQGKTSHYVVSLPAAVATRSRPAPPSTSPLSSVSAAELTRRRTQETYVTSALGRPC